MKTDLFSIVIPYHAQSETLELLKKQLNYYDKNQCVFDVIIAASGDPVVIENLEFYVSTLNLLNVHVLKFPDTNIKNMKTFISKTYKALKSVKTPYVAINGADDVLIPNAVAQCCELLEKDPDIAAIKGRTVFFNENTGSIVCAQDLENMDNVPYKRMRIAAEYRDSMFYIIRKTTELLKEYKVLKSMSELSAALALSPDHTEHFRSLSAVSFGKFKVIEDFWRIQVEHSNNSGSWSQSGFLRIKWGVIDQKTYKIFQTLNHNTEQLSYMHYSLLWIWYQTRLFSMPIIQIIYQYYKQNCSTFDVAAMMGYKILHLAYRGCKKILPKGTLNEELVYYCLNNEFIKKPVYQSLKENFFSNREVALIEACRKSIPQGERII